MGMGNAEKTGRENGLLDKTVRWNGSLPIFGLPLLFLVLQSIDEMAVELDDGKGIVRAIVGVKYLNGKGALHFAATKGKIEIWKYLVDEVKLDVDLKDGKGETLLLHAALGGHLSTGSIPYKKRVLIPRYQMSRVSLHYILLQKKKDLWFVTRDGSLSEIDSASALLKKNGGNIDVRNVFGLTALHIATWKNQIPIVRRLFAVGTDRDARDGESGWSSLQRAIHFGHLAVAIIHLQSSASLSLEDSKSRTLTDLLSGLVLEVVRDEHDSGTLESQRFTSSVIKLNSRGGKGRLTTEPGFG